MLVSAADPVGSLTTLATEGGEVVLINGTDLGPAANRTLVNSVGYSGGLFSYNLQNCTFVAAHTALQCLTPSGVGAGFRAQVTVMYQPSGQSSDLLSYRAPAISVASPGVIPTSGSTVTLNGTSFGAAPEQITLYVNGVVTPVNLVVAHKSVSFRADEAPGFASLSLLVVVGGQSSNTVSVSFSSPSITSIVEYNVSALSPAAQAVDSCFVALTDINTQAVFQLQGQNFGSVPGQLSIPFSNGSTPFVCAPCYAAHSVARCIATVSRGSTFNVSATLAGQASSVSVFTYALIVDTTPPFVSSAYMSDNSTPVTLGTVGGNVLVLSGTKFGASCALVTAFIGISPLNLTSCNSTTIVARTPAGTGLLGTLTMTVSSTPALIGGGASMTFSYIPPEVSALVVAGGTLPTLGFSAGGTPSNVTLVGSNFGPAGSSLVVTFVSAADGLVRTATNCTRDPVGHAWISCFGVVGVGTGHRWMVVVGGQASNASAQTTSFLPPQLLDISGTGSRFANTDGGQLVVISWCWCCAPRGAALLCPHGVCTATRPQAREDGNAVPDPPCELRVQLQYP